MRVRRTAGLLLAAMVVLTGSTGCSAGSGERGARSSPRGGTLFYLTRDEVPGLDPQRMYGGRELFNLDRLVYRGLVTYPVTSDPARGATPVPDLATDTGTASEHSKTWTFTLKQGVRWQDGKPVTCADLAYGVSRSFATREIIGGPGYALSYLDVPRDGQGLPLYDGPYENHHADDFRRAVTCSPDDRTITYRFNRPWPDFPLAVASLLAFDPYRRDQDRGGKSLRSVFSTGPYRLQGDWSARSGGTFVRNEQWSAATDQVRKALPARITFRLGLDAQFLTERLVADTGDDRAAVTDSPVEPSQYAEVTGPVADRAQVTGTPYVLYLVLNVNRLTDVRVRRALVLAADTQGYRTAIGGPQATGRALSLVSPAVPGYRPNPAFTGPPQGDRVAARRLLRAAGVRTPYPVNFTYPGHELAADKAASALKEGWDRAGFEVTLDPLGQEYFDAVASPDAPVDVAWGAWGADWPSMSTVLPPLFDSRVNLTAESNGQDLGNYRSERVNQLVDRAAAVDDLAEQVPIYQRIDARLGRDAAYIPLLLRRAWLLHGSAVRGFVLGPGYGAPDLGAIGVTGD